MDKIGLKQVDLIKKVKKYFNEISYNGIDVSKSSFCYIPNYGLNPGNTRLIQWIKKNYINFQNIKIILNHILSITSYYNYELLNLKKKTTKAYSLPGVKNLTFKKKLLLTIS